MLEKGTTKLVPTATYVDGPRPLDSDYADQQMAARYEDLSDLPQAAYAEFMEGSAQAQAATIIAPSPMPDNFVDLWAGLVRFKGMFLQLDQAQLRAVKRIVVSALQANLEAEVQDAEEAPPAAD